MYRSVVGYTFKDVFLPLCSRGGAPKCRRAQGNVPPTLPLDGPGYIKNTLINALRN